MIQNSFRINSGLNKGLKFKYPSIAGLRPTKSIIKETLFNWLQFSIQNAKVLDLFSGSGSLSFEAISREASSVVLIENDRTAFKFLKENTKNLQTNCSIKVINEDALNFIGKIKKGKFDIIFLDPPFYKDLISKTLQRISESKIVLSNSKIYIESEFEISNFFLEKFLTKEFNLLKQKKTGDVFFCLIEIL